MKKISILGSTGSIGTQALDVISRNPDKFSVAALSCAKSIDKLKEQIRTFRPEAVCVAAESDAADVNEFCDREGIPAEICHGREGLKAIASMRNCDIVLNSLMGMRGLEPTLAAIEAGHDIAFANKETLVAGGELVMSRVRASGIKMLPVDSEHSAIFQALQGNKGNKIKRIILTASGGPFRGYTKEQLKKVTLQQALRHPNWKMGKKITIDSATLMNKGLEIIEARWLFDVPVSKIQVVVHPQSVLHSAVEYEDGSIIGQMGMPDMRVPIGYAFSYPERLKLTYDPDKTFAGNPADPVQSLDFFSLKEGMTFYPPDREVFKTIDLACEAIQAGGSCTAALNGANEVLVDLFLKGRIAFTDIQDTLEKIMDSYKPKFNLSLEDILEEDRLARAEALRMVEV